MSNEWFTINTLTVSATVNPSSEAQSLNGHVRVSIGLPGATK